MQGKQPKKTSKVEDSELAKKAEEYLAGWQRTQADFDNYRRRIEGSRHEVAGLAVADFALKITPIVDDFRRAFQSVPADQTTSPWVAGMHQVEKRLLGALAEHQLKPIDQVGEFDPHLHEAIATTKDEKIPAGHIIDIVELGWKLGDKVLKPARVRVSQGQE